MKKTSLYIAIAAIGGLLAGYLFFGDTSGESVGGAHDHNLEVQSGQIWTCSMHPQIMQPEPGDCPICGMDLIPSQGQEEGLHPGQFRMSENALALADVQTTIVGSATNDDSTLKLSGKIRANDKAVGTQAAFFEGRIEELYVNFEGEEVRSGQKLATLYAPELVSAQQELITASGLKASQPELYKAVRNKLKLWKLTEKQILEIEASGQVQENFPVYATVSGTVSQIGVQAGDYVEKGAPLFKIANLGTVWAVFDAYENQVSLLKEGQTMNITAKSYPQTPIEAKISFISPGLNPATRIVEVRTVLQNPDGKLKPGMFVSGTLDLSPRNDNQALVIPESAVLWTGRRSVVYVKANPNAPVFEMREIEVGDAINEGYLVLSGLENGEEIVTQGTFTVDAAAQLRGKRSMMNEENGQSSSGHGDHLNASPGSSGPGQPNQKEMNFSQALKTDLASTIPGYLKMKDALVSEDAGTVQKIARELSAHVSGLQTAGLGSREKSHISNIQKSLKAIGDSNSLGTQRENFVTLNESLIPILEVSGSAAQTLYVQTCPMANNSNGAEWLSAEKEIRNPYYGEAMLRCGSIIDTLQ
jgi:Cu(I)/Ag(I) efflux system membrane fusion protein